MLIPVYNESAVLERSIDRVLAQPPPRLPDGTFVDRVLILVDDGSTDGSTEIVKRLADRGGVRCVVRAHNEGKGCAIRDALDEARAIDADTAIIQDADMEYDPADHDRVLAPIFDGRADAVIGSRFIGETHRVLYFWHSVGNRFLTLLSNMLSNLNLTDMECGTKAFSRDVLERLTVSEPRFGIEPEIVARLSKMRLPDRNSTRALRIYELPVAYAGRTYAEGKKIGWRDGIEALRCIAWYNLFGVARRRDPAPRP